MGLRGEGEQRKAPRPVGVRSLNGTRGQVEVLANGDVSIAFILDDKVKPMRGAPVPKNQTLPAAQLLGARHEGTPTCFSIWSATEHEQRHGRTTRLLYKIHHTDKLEADNADAAGALVTHIRRASSWWGRSRPPHVAVLVNPVSGCGTGNKVAGEVLLPLLRDVAGLRVTQLVTERPMHAADLVYGMRLAGCGGDGGGGGRKEGVEDDGEDAVDLIAFCGGDGTLYEGLQGLMRRPDWSSAVRVPLAPVPTGSGNGLAASAGLWDVATAAVALCRGRAQPIDVASVLQPPASRSYCLLSVVYGSMANLDIGTEHLRWLGEVRFQLGGVWETLWARNYRCRLYVLPPEVAEGMAAAEVEKAAAAGKDGKAGGGVRTQSMLDNGDECSSGGGGGGGGSCGGGSSSSTGIDNRSGSNGGGGGGDGGRQLLEGCPPPGLERSKSSQLLDYPDGPPLPILSRLPFLPGPLPDTCRPLPEGWVQVSPFNSFGILGAYNPQCIATNARVNPGGSMCDGAWDVWYLEAEPETSPWTAPGASLASPESPPPAPPKPRGRRSASLLQRGKYLKLLLGCEDGSFALGTCPLKHMRARALMLEQVSTDTWTVLDGEAVRPDPLYLEVHPGLLRVCVSPRFAELEV